jgi:mannose-6-phosphate isomerase-like protein (cupin superfamily)
MQDMGDYQMLAHIETPEFSMHLLSLGDKDCITPHYHDDSKQLYVILEGVVEVTLGDRTFHLCPYETTHIERHTVHDIRPVSGRALVVSICSPPLKLEDQHPVECSDVWPAACNASALSGCLQKAA